MIITDWPTGQLIPYARNPRSNEHAVSQLAGVIREFGFLVPILAKSDGTVIDGHLRLKAAIALELATVPVIVADDLTEDADPGIQVGGQ
jgi:ParB-like chromosome segregation protein Spo0J